MDAVLTKFVENFHDVDFFFFLSFVFLNNKAWKIAKTGFASLSLIDGGYFGKGIYFTTSVPYGFRYASYNNAGPKALIISWVC